MTQWSDFSQPEIYWNGGSLLTVSFSLGELIELFLWVIAHCSGGGLSEELILNWQSVGTCHFLGAILDFEYEVSRLYKCYRICVLLSDKYNSFAKSSQLFDFLLDKLSNTRENKSNEIDIHNEGKYNWRMIKHLLIYANKLPLLKQRI